MSGEPAGCARVISSLNGEQSPKTSAPSQPPMRKEEIKMGVHVGQQAPDFTAAAYHKGDFTSVKLSNYLGKWVMLCFYPGDFTFV